MQEEKETGTNIFSVLNKSLIFLVGILFFYSGYRAVFILKSTDDASLRTKSVFEEVSSVREIALVEPKPYRYYARQFEKKDIFKLSPIVPAQEKGPETTKSLPDEREFMENLKLTGIVLDNNPEAIIENLKTKETLFLHKGDRVHGAVVEDIRDGKVILRYHNKMLKLE